MWLETDAIGSALYLSFTERLLNRAMSCNLKKHSTLQNNSQNKLQKLSLNVFSHLFISLETGRQTDEKYHKYMP
jgi:hypothetical protein